MGRRVRIEHDSMGPMRIPVDVLYGPSTARAVENFPISGSGIPATIVHALGWIKWAAVQTNVALKLVPPKIGHAIQRAAREVAEGRWDAQFVVDLYQTGSGTSSNMNANEVIAHRARAWLRRPEWPHPNDHVNYGQSSNDVFPTAIHVATLRDLSSRLLPTLERLQVTLQEKARQFQPIVKSGRTHLQDATPIRLGQEFSGYAHQIRLARERFRGLVHRLGELPLGGTAVGTGVNTHPRFARRVIAFLKRQLKLPLREARNHFQAQAAPDTLVELSGCLKELAVALMKIGNDIRWLASGPRCGLGELRLPAVQPGSSMMPGKVNPVIVEALLQVCVRVIANDTAVTLGGQGSNFELNTMYPIIGASLAESIALAAAAVENFRAKCLVGLTADIGRCEELLERNLAVGTSLAPIIGYNAAAALVKQAFTEGTTLREMAYRTLPLPRTSVDRVLDPSGHTTPGIPKK